MIIIVSSIISAISALAGVFLKEYLDKKSFLYDDVKEAYKLSDQLIYSSTDTAYCCDYFVKNKKLPSNDYILKYPDKTNEIIQALGLIVFLRLNKLEKEFKQIQEKTNERTDYFCKILLQPTDAIDDIKNAPNNLTANVTNAVVKFQKKLREEYLKSYLTVIKNCVCGKLKK